MRSENLHLNQRPHTDAARGGQIRHKFASAEMRNIQDGRKLLEGGGVKEAGVGKMVVTEGETEFSIDMGLKSCTCPTGDVLQTFFCRHIYACMMWSRFGESAPIFGRRCLVEVLDCNETNTEVESFGARLSQSSTMWLLPPLANGNLRRNLPERTRMTRTASH